MSLQLHHLPSVFPILELLGGVEEACLARIWKNFNFEFEFFYTCLCILITEWDLFQHWNDQSGFVNKEWKAVGLPRIYPGQTHNGLM